MGRIRKLTAVGAAASALLLGLPAAALASAQAQPGRGTVTGAVRVVQYRGYRVRVPAGWPVYNLAADPSRCVLFNRHAVYLGQPGSAQRCPERAFGRTEALLIQPLAPAGNLPPGMAVQRGTSAALPAGAAAAEDAASHELQVALPAAGVQVTATYGRDAAQARAILASAQVTSYRAAAGSGAAAPDTAAPDIGAPDAATPRGAARTAARAPVGSRATGTGAGAAGRRVAGPQELVGETGSGLGFDACTAPSVATMSSWLNSPYRVAGTYLGGDNWACSYGNFTSSWVTQVAAEGWKFIPIWVGPQALCSTIPGAVLINPAQAAAEGQSQAASAVTTAASFGYGAGTPVYFDMEGYDSSNTACKQGVLDFLAGWTQGLHAAGYTSGVYSSAASGIADLASQYGNPSYSSPDDIWIADWTGDPVLADPYVPNADWPGHTRLHQYYGGHLETWGGASVDIDSDAIDGAVAGLSNAPASPQAFLYSLPDAVSVAPGSASRIALLAGTTGAGAGARGAGGHGRGTLVHWQVQAPAGLTVTPSQGVAYAALGHPVPVPVTVQASTSTAPGRYDLPVSSTANGQPLAQTFELVSVVASGAALPAPQPIVLYAADKASMAVAVSTAQRLALPLTDVTGNFTDAWNDVAGGSDLVLSVGQAALNGLNNNTCGWPDPAGTGAGSTPFYYAGQPLAQPAGADVFENSADTSTLLTALVTARLMHYALTAALPDEGGQPVGPNAPTQACLGSPDVPVL
jgi:Domain of unknown function (DUF1906)